MKHMLSVLLSVITLIGHAQTILAPGENIFDKKYLKSGNYEMALFMEMDGKLEEAFLFTLSINYTSQKLAIYTSMVMLLDTTEVSKDTSISDANTFKPIYRSSNSKYHKYTLY